MARAIVLAVLGIGVVAGCVEEAPMDNYVIAYNVLYNPDADNYEVFSMNMDGSEKRNISNLPGVEWTYHAWGDRIFFISDKDTAHRQYFLYEMDAQGGNVKKVYDRQLADSWLSTRRSGTELVVKPHRTVDSAFHIISRNGKLLKRVVIDLPTASDPCFVGDGSRIVFRGGTRQSKLVEGYEEEIYIVRDDGTGLRRLTHYPKGDTSAGRFAYRAGPPMWNAAGYFVSYQSKQAGKYSLYAVDLNGTNQRKLTDNPQSEGWHAWSPDGRWLAIELFDEAQTQFHIGLMNWETKEMKILTDTSYVYQQGPVFVRR